MADKLTTELTERIHVYSDRSVAQIVAMRPPLPQSGKVESDPLPPKTTVALWQEMPQRAPLIAIAISELEHAIYLDTPQGKLSQMANGPEFNTALLAALIHTANPDTLDAALVLAADVTQATKKDTPK